MTSTSRPDAGSAAPMLSLRGLTVRYGDATAVSGVDLTLEAHQFGAVLGANGAGKSSLAKAVARLLPSTGSIVVDGQDVTRMASDRLVRDGVVYVPEGRRVFGQASVEDNLRAGAFIRRKSHPWRERLAEIYEWIPRLKERADVKAELLSGGEQQLLAIGRGLMAQPRLMILDEPSLGLSPRAIDTVVAFLREVAAAESLSILVCEQNTSFASRLADRAWAMKLGELQEPVGPDVISDPEALVRMVMGAGDPH
jgi:branched-chain amino acid transport system ATP-binding protein